MPSSPTTKYKFCVSGAAETEHCAKQSLELAKALGAEIARRGCVLLTGATSGIPYWAAIGAKEAGGLSIGFSPAASELAHVKTYRLPTHYFDVIVYTGFEYAGRNLILTRASDAVFIVCGRIGTLNEFSIAFEEQKPLGVLTGTGGTADMVRDIIKKGRRGSGSVIYDANPRRLVERMIKFLDESRRKERR